MDKLETIYFGTGCFWCSEASFLMLRGVVGVTSGYAGGTVPNPSYLQVCSGNTGHAEVVKVEYDPAIISFTDLLNVFFTIHDPTTFNRQGNDIGTQYRSIILHTTDSQRLAAANYISKITNDHIFRSHIVTQIVPFADFYPAESDHYRYYSQNSEAPYCQVVINPKIAKLRSSFSHLLKD